MDNNFFKGEEPTDKKKRAIVTSVIVIVFIGVVSITLGYYFKSNFFVPKNGSNKLTETDKQKLIRQILKNRSTVSKSERGETIKNIEGSSPGVVGKEERQRTAASLQVNK